MTCSCGREDPEVATLRNDLESTLREVEQLRVQLAGCSVAAQGGIRDPAVEGQFGWSRAYQDVLELRQAYEDLLTKYRELRDQKKPMSLRLPRGAPALDRLLDGNDFED